MRRKQNIATSMQGCTIVKLFIVVNWFISVQATSLPGLGKESRKPPPTSCAPYKQLISEVITASTRDYVTDNWNEYDVIDTTTPSSLYRSVYSERASPLDYVTTVMSFVYADSSGRGTANSCEKLKDQIVGHVALEDYDQGRKALGKLLMSTVGQLVEKKFRKNLSKVEIVENWEEFRCLQVELKDEAQLMMAADLSKFVLLSSPKIYLNILRPVKCKKNVFFYISSTHKLCKPTVFQFKTIDYLLLFLLCIVLNLFIYSLQT